MIATPSPAVAAAERRLLELAAAAAAPPTPLELRQALQREAGIPPAAARAALRRMVQAGHLGYRALHGRTVLGPNTQRPLRVASRVILSPPGISPACSAGEVVVRLAAGAAFGDGEHPSTRLAIGQLERLLEGSVHAFRGMLDVGTGSGVLALAALHLGVARVVALDTDPCALEEARTNAALNGLQGQMRMVVSSRAVERLAGLYPLIAANLRPPTLGRLAPHLRRLAAPGAVLVLAGLRTTEAERLQALYAAQRFACRWQQAEAGWCAMVLELDQSLPIKAA
jgi:ribosomal protein L11 methyltransferase